MIKGSLAILASSDGQQCCINVAPYINGSGVNVFFCKTTDGHRLVLARSVSKSGELAFPCASTDGTAYISASYFATALLVAFIDEATEYNENQELVTAHAKELMDAIEEVKKTSKLNVHVIAIDIAVDRGAYLASDNVLPVDVDGITRVVSPRFPTPEQIEEMIDGVTGGVPFSAILYVLDDSGSMSASQVRPQVAQYVNSIIERRGQIFAKRHIFNDELWILALRDIVEELDIVEIVNPVIFVLADYSKDYFSPESEFAAFREDIASLSEAVASFEFSVSIVVLDFQYEDLYQQSAPVLPFCTFGNCERNPAGDIIPYYKRDEEDVAWLAAKLTSLIASSGASKLTVFLTGRMFSGVPDEIINEVESTANQAGISASFYDFSYERGSAFNAGYTNEIGDRHLAYVSLYINEDSAGLLRIHSYPTVGSFAGDEKELIVVISSGCKQYMLGQSPFPSHNHGYRHNQPWHPVGFDYVGGGPFYDIFYNDLSVLINSIDNSVIGGKVRPDVCVIDIYAGEFSPLPAVTTTPYPTSHITGDSNAPDGIPGVSVVDIATYVSWDRDFIDLVIALSSGHDMFSYLPKRTGSLLEDSESIFDQLITAVVARLDFGGIPIHGFPFLEPKIQVSTSDMRAGWGGSERWIPKVIDVIDDIKKYNQRVKEFKRQ